MNWFVICRTDSHFLRGDLVLLCLCLAILSVWRRYTNHTEQHASCILIIFGCTCDQQWIAINALFVQSWSSYSVIGRVTLITSFNTLFVCLPVAAEVFKPQRFKSWHTSDTSLNLLTEWAFVIINASYIQWIIVFGTVLVISHLAIQLCVSLLGSPFLLETAFMSEDFTVSAFWHIPSLCPSFRMHDCLGCRAVQGVST